MPARTVLVVEDNLSGHRRTYVELLVSAAVAAGVDTHVLLSREDGGAAEKLGRSLRCTVHVLSDCSLTEIAGLASELRADTVVIPDGDRDVLRLGLGSAWKCEAELRLLVMRRHAQPRRSSAVQAVVEMTRRVLFAMAARRRRVCVYYLESALRPSGSPTGVSDPITFHPSASAPVVLDEDRFWFGVVGAIDERKNVPLVVEAAATLDQPVGVVLAGAQSERVRDYMRRQVWGSASAVVVDRRLDDGDLDAILRDVDCVVLAYSNTGPSGLIGKAAMAGTRVLAADCPELRKDCATLGESAVVSQLTVTDLARAMHHLTTVPRPDPRSLDAVDFVNKLILRP